MAASPVQRGIMSNLRTSLSDEQVFQVVAVLNEMNRHCRKTGETTLREHVVYLRMFFTGSCDTVLGSERAVAIAKAVVDFKSGKRVLDGPPEEKP